MFYKRQDQLKIMNNITANAMPRNIRDNKSC